MKIINAAKVLHETTMSMCKINGFPELTEWDDLTQPEKDSVALQVKHFMDKPESEPGEFHNGLLEKKIADGWKLADQHDSVKKESPFLIPFDQLPLETQMKEHLLIGVIKSLSTFIEND